METLIFVLITLLKQPKSSYVAPTCYQRLADTDVIVTIANETGYIAGQPKRDEIGTKYKINNFCK